MNARSTQATAANVLEDREALYYPYIHIRDEEWLKKTLLVVAGMKRMIGEGFTPDDSPLVKELSAEKQGQKPLLRRANLAAPEVMGEQGDLVRLIEEDIAKDAKTFQARFGEAAARSIRRARGDPYGFQMHLAKTAWGVEDLLRRNGLAWKPDHPDRQEYHELHPDLGRAVMGFLAVSCAQTEGLNIVAQGNDQPSRELNRFAAVRDPGAVYKQVVRGESRPDPSSEDKGTALLEMLVYLNCDVSKVTAEGLYDLSKERDPLRALKVKLHEIAQHVPTVGSEKVFAAKLQEEVDRVLDCWQGDRANMSAYAKEVFTGTGEGVKALAEKFPEIATAVSTGTAVSSVAAQPWLGAAAGLAIGAVVHTIRSVAKVRERSNKSPFRFLTAAEKKGVLFSVGR